MVDIVLESVRTVIMGIILGYIWWIGKRENLPSQQGWRYIVAGFVLIFLGGLFDITDNFDDLNRYLIIGDTPYEAFLEKVVGNLVGSVLLLVGLWYWLPLVVRTARAERNLARVNSDLEIIVEKRTVELKDTIGQLERELTERKRIEGMLKESESVQVRIARENAVLAELGRIVSSTLDIDQVYERFAESVGKLLAFDRIAILIVDQENETISRPYVAGDEIPEWGIENIQPLAGSVAEWIIRNRSPLLIGGGETAAKASELPYFALAVSAGLPSLLAVPLISNDDIIGTLNFRSARLNAFDKSDLETAERIALQVSSAIANSQIYTERRRAEEALREHSENLALSNRQLEEAMTQVKTLSGMLPICSSCKRIRDDTGYWNQIETYIHQNSDARLSHGLCPPCAKQLFPDQYSKLYPDSD